MRTATAAALLLSTLPWLGCSDTEPEPEQPAATAHEHDGHEHDGHEHDGHAHDGHAHAGHAHEGEAPATDPEQAALRQAAAEAAGEGPARKPWQPSEQDDHHDHDHDHGEHEHGEHEHAHGEHAHGEHAPEKHDGALAEGQRPAKERRPAGWLPSQVGRPLLEGHDPAELWRERHGQNVALRVQRPFALRTVRYGGEERGVDLFEPPEDGGAQLRIEAGEELKLVAVVAGLHRHGDHDHVLSEVYLYLRRRPDGAIEALLALDPLQPTDLLADDVERFKSKEPTSIVVRRAGQKPVANRVEGQVAVGYLRLLERVPARAAQAADAGGAQELDELLRKLGHDGNEPVTVWVQVPAVLGGLRLVTLRKELGRQGS